MLHRTEIVHSLVIMYCIAFSGGEHIYSSTGLLKYNFEVLVLLFYAT